VLAKVFFGGSLIQPGLNREGKCSERLVARRWTSSFVPIERDEASLLQLRSHEQIGKVKQRANDRRVIVSRQRIVTGAAPELTRGRVHQVQGLAEMGYVVRQCRVGDGAGSTAAGNLADRG
jgi:hypothetical protein